MTVHQRIKQFRESRKLTHQQFADAVGVSRGAVQQWEKEDGTAPNRSRQPAVAEYMGISVEELMSESTANLSAPSGTLTATGSASNQPLATMQQAQAAIPNEVKALAVIYAAIKPEFRNAAISAATNAMISFLSPHTTPEQDADDLDATLSESPQSLPASSKIL